MKTKHHTSESIHICLISDQPIANLLPLLLEKPRQAIFLVSPQMTAHAERLKKLAQPRGITVTLCSGSAFAIKSESRACPDS